MKPTLTIHAYTDLRYTYSGWSALLNALVLLRECPHPISIRWR